MNWDNWMLYLVAANGYVFFIFGMGQLFQHDKRTVNYWGFFFFEYTAVMFLLSAAINNNIIKIANFEYFDPFIISLGGTLFFFYFIRVVDAGYRFLWKDQWLFLPPILFMITAAALFFSLDSFHETAWVAFLGLSILWFVFCCILLLRRAARKGGGNLINPSRRLVFLFFIAGGLTVNIISFYLFLLFGNSVVFFIFITSVFILFMIFYVTRNPLLRLSAETKASYSGHIERSKIANLDVVAVIQQLGQIMEKEKPYRKETLSLSGLADMLGLSVHQLSEILNKVLGVNFNTYINNYRIKDMQRMLIERPGLSILEAAFECGFRSKSSFNRIFRDSAGMTPSEYRKNGAENGGE